MDLDVNTLFLVTMHVEIMLGLLLFFAWAQSFSKRALAWWGSAHLLRAVSILLLGLHGSIPAWASIELGNAALFGIVRADLGRRPRVRPPQSRADLVLLRHRGVAARGPDRAADGGSTELRLLLGSGIVTAYIWLAAYEFWRGRKEALISRWPVIFMLFAHGALFLLRTPVSAMAHMRPTRRSASAPGSIS